MKQEKSHKKLVSDLQFKYTQKEDELRMMTDQKDS